MNHHTPTFTAERLLDILRSLPVANAYVVGFSGGADSTALLHALASIRNQLALPVSAIHVNHKLHEKADRWQSECETFCHLHGVELVCVDIQLNSNSGKGMEAEARHKRYEVMSAKLAPGECLLTAHHADDQAETLLLNLMRGSGVDGLSAMPASRPLGNGLLQRPLLGFQNMALRDYLHQHGIRWSEDPSNQRLDHDRNFVRHEIIPLLEQRWPGVGKRLLLTRNAMTDARSLLEGLADTYIEENLAHTLVMNLSAKLLMDQALLKLVIRRWLKKSGASSIPAYSLVSFCEQVQHAVSDNQVSVRWDGWILRLYKQQLWLQEDRNISPCPSVSWPSGQNRIELGADTGQIELQHQEDNAVTPDGLFKIGSRITFSDTGIEQRNIHRSVKNLFQEASIPPWLRSCIPICQLNGELVALGDWCVSSDFVSWMSEKNVSLKWNPHHPLLDFIRTRQHR